MKYIFSNTTLGNDIIDLSQPDIFTKHSDQRFLQRVFSIQEQAAIQNSKNSSHVLWSIWAAKEAAYKACQKQNLDLIFAHKKFSVSDITLKLLQNSHQPEELTGNLFFGEQLIALRWQWTPRNVHCTAVNFVGSNEFQNWQAINYCIEELDLKIDINLRKHFSENEWESIFTAESAQTRLHAKHFLQTLGFDKNIEIIRLNRSTRLTPPQLYLNQNLLANYEISLSHDGRWMAAALLNNNVY